MVMRGLTTIAEMALVAAAVACSPSVKVVGMSDYGIVPGADSLTERFASALRELKDSGGDSLVLVLEPGRYDFHPSSGSVRECFISNHGRFEGSVGIDLEGFSHVTLDGGGADMVFHGSMLPVRLARCENCTLRNFSVDVAEPLADIGRIARNPENGSASLEMLYDNPGIEPFFAMVIDGSTRHLVYDTGDVGLPYDAAPEGSVLIMRSGVRPCPAVFLEDDSDASLESVSVFGAHGMGVLAQMCHNVTLEGCRVVPRDEDHYMSALCDATHFSQCSGTILSERGRYEAMGDDAINVHGIGLSVAGRTEGNVFLLEFRHHETFGLEWGRPGDRIQFLSKRTSLPVGSGLVRSIRPLDAKTLMLEVDGEIPPEVAGPDGYCAENLSRTPDVVFRFNLVGNNRARGALFTTPGKVVVTGNTFDHVAGTAILISGDCNGWYETGACRDVLVSGNRFIDCLTSRYGGCEAVVSIAPEIADLRAQGDSCFHSGIRILNNEFVDFGSPLIYARSVRGLEVKGNVITPDDNYPPLFPDRQRIVLLHVLDSFCDENQ